ncbi:ketoacyl-ACP synthase III [Shewanella morhuae]|uniref:3-oxoacyl-[acyl-carrier-protein] synthase 3 n=1 Tax=Shewanella morhuae TaxID=365591 RepID=A0A380A7S3_9GAMM|nr:ketoacyl-ACP synthase III [Shewanella morhuae]PTA50804.1 ketoacyl-ACP synthase III [Shewanella morhuae]SUI75970.1 3-oxoacyl-[acyl-carrier-protein] synthase 3 [Shewanella morhuae]
MEAVIKSVKIAGMQAAVPTHRHSYVDTPDIFTQEEANKIFASTGIHSRRILPSHLCASDMCIAAAQTLLQRLDWPPETIDILIYVSQDSDYALPATACLMQHRLGLPQSAACLDVSLGCSGFVYGTWIASQLLNSSNGKRALVLCGDTSSRHLLPDDRGTLPLFGDAGVATALEYDENWPDSYAVFGTDGTGGQHIAVKAGGRRNPTMPGLSSRSRDEEQRLYKESRLYLNGAAVFSFTLKVVPKLVKDALLLAQLEVDDLDMVVMHQANHFILEHLRKKVKVPGDKYLIDMKDFGNTSSASVPLAICHQLSDFFTKETKKVMLGGFGVGWSWGAIITDIGPIVAPEIIEINDDFEALSLIQQ